MTDSGTQGLSTRAAKLLLAAAATLIACTALAPAASAGVLVKSAGDCAPQPLERPFLRWIDPAQYTLLPGGTFEQELPDWTLSGARVVSGNEPYYVHGEGRALLALPSGRQQGDLRGDLRRASAIPPCASSRAAPVGRSSRR